MSRPRPFGRAVLAVLVAVLAMLLGGPAPAAAGTVLPDVGRAAAPADSGTPGALKAVAGHPATDAAGPQAAPAPDPARAPDAAPGVRAGAGAGTGRAPLRAVPGRSEAPDAPRAAAAVRGGGPS
ncbi:hypothetical protein ACWGSG_36555, partial [Streptomyces yangpuensis]